MIWSLAHLKTRALHLGRQIGCLPTIPSNRHRRAIFPDILHISHKLCTVTQMWVGGVFSKVGGSWREL
jgi:hypothetical protein